MKEKFAKCLPYDNNLKGRIGGAPPKLIEKLILDQYVFYATLVHPEKDKIMISILIHKDFDILLENNIYPKIEVQVVEHEYSEEGNSDKRHSELGKGSISEYEDSQGKFLFIKVFGEPQFIQHKNYYFEDLEKDGYSFFLQIDEEGYSDDLKCVFMYGALYLYKHNTTEMIIAGFWQYS